MKKYFFLFITSISFLCWAFAQKIDDHYDVRNSVFKANNRIAKGKSKFVLTKANNKSNSSGFILPKKGINQFIIYGQSLSTGQQTPPALSIKNYSGNLMLGGQVWSNFENDIDNPSLIFHLLTAKPTIASHKTNEEILNDTTIDSNSQINCEPPVIGFTNAVSYYLKTKSSNYKNPRFAATSCGEGGRSIELLMKDCPNRDGMYYKHFEKLLTKSGEAAARMGEDISCQALLWMQGEYNYTQALNQGWQPNTIATNSKIAYKAYFSQLVTDMLSDVKINYHQTLPPVFITYQCGAQFTRGFDVPIGMAQLEVSNSDKRIVLAGPVYPVTDRGGHLCPNGSRWYGEMMAKVYYKTVILNKHWSPLQPIRLLRGINYIDVDFKVPEKPLKFDTLTLQKVKNYGFAIKVAGKQIPILAINLIGSDKVRLMTGNEPILGEVEINYAGPDTNGNGNLCDSDDFQSFETYQDLSAPGLTLKQRDRFKPRYQPLDKNGSVIYNKKYPLQNFSCAFYYRIPANKNRIKCF